ncbi:MAG TPA: hypothetical protein VJ165_04325 [candidate division Zixibacteria bacterium]|nr:hypothetical protein [candidate division Zixibacteria bacterium]
MTRKVLFLTAVCFSILTFFYSDGLAQVYAPSDSLTLAIGTTDTTFLNLSDVDSVWFKWFRTVTGGSNVIVDSSKITSSTRTGYYQKKIKVSDGSNNLGQYLAFITAFKNGKTVRVKTNTWQVLSFGLNKIQHPVAESSLVMAEISGLNGITPPSGSDYTSARAGNLDRVDENISGIDDNPWDNATRILTDTTNIGEKIANRSAEKVWSFSNPITLADTIPKVFAVNAGSSNPDTIANHVWSWSTRTLTSGTGTGANQVTLTVKDAADSVTVLNGVQVQVLNQAQTATEGLLTSNSLGQAIFALNNATYKVRLFKPGHVFAVPESVIVAGTTSKTFYGSAFNPGTPPSPALCRVFGYVKDINNLPVVGAKIEALIKTVPLRYQAVLISPYYKTTTTDANGYWFLDLYPNSILNPGNTKYLFSVTVTSGAILKLETTVPNQSSWELSF